MDFTYLILIVITLAIGFGAQGYVNHMLNKYSRVRTSSYFAGAQVADGMLRYYGITDVKVFRGTSSSQDFYSPRKNSITLSPNAYDGASITALATACHEAGHACQYAENYRPMKIRGAIVPVANVASYVWIFVLIIGIALVSMRLVIVAIVIYAVVVIFQLVTLPVEFNATHRAMTYMDSIGLPENERKASAQVLRACALTYVAAALTSILQLIWLLAGSRR